MCDDSTYGSPCNNWSWLRKTPWVNTCVLLQVYYSDLFKVCEIRVAGLIKLLLHISLVDSPPAWLASYQLCTSTATVLFGDPKDVTVEANQWAQFNCTVRCGYYVSWYMSGYSRAIKRNNTVPGLLIKRRRASGCTESGEIIFFFEVLATEAFNKSTFYCAAYETRREICSCGTEGRCYSRPALFTGTVI